MKKILIGFSENIDFEKWNNNPDQYKITLPQNFVSDKINKINTHTFRLFAMQDSELIIGIRILNVKYFSMRSIFMQCAKIKINTPYRAIFQQNKIFAAVIKNPSVANLPLFLPNLDQDGKYPNYLIGYTQIIPPNTLTNLELTKDQQKIFQNNAFYWKDKTQIVMPYIPFFQNCQNMGEYIFFEDFIENEEYCQIYDTSQTKPINQVTFGDVPISDTCKNVELTCVMDDAFLENPAQIMWFQTVKQDVLFYLTNNPIDITKIINENKMFTYLDLIPVIVQSDIPSNKLPTIVELQIKYYQVDKENKIIITALVYFKQLVDIEQYKSKKQAFKYVLNISFLSMTQAELAIAFALDWIVYLILSLLIGTFSVVMISIFSGYHALMNKMFKRQVKAKFNIFKGYFKQFYPPLIIGISFSCVPVFFISFLCSIIMTGGFWDVQFFPCSVQDNCQSFFEYFDVFQFQLKININIFLKKKQPFLLFENTTQQIRSGRTGLAQIVIGIYSTMVMYLFIKESHDGNIWNEQSWHRMYFFQFNIFIWIVMIFIMYLSFSTVYGKYIWYFMVVLKVFQIVFEEWLKLYVCTELKLNLLSVLLSQGMQIAGLGAIDFFDFLFSYFVGLGIQCFEKTHQVLSVKYLTDYFFEISEQIQKYLKKIISKSEDIDLDEEDDNTTLEKSNQNILFSNNIDDFQKVENHKFIYEQQQQYKINVKKQLYELQETDKYEKYYQHYLKTKFNNQQNQKTKQNKQNYEQSEYSNQLEIYCDFSNNSFTIFYYAIYKIKNIQLIIYFKKAYINHYYMDFYDENEIPLMFGISKAGLVFYFLFNVAIIPFQNNN
ncbi:hypothetical protein IMG5_167590 [Ichthyophthirius multifiliis]|uniref:Transmembrane protein n=1 Tax=Ichthyophthirius multifiliis TaxID=5932 RepID=G0R0Y5_ICHMU|nr:hypothetical protein IMG5_167590 [Ichthyophthirius multifiliis]EGR28850.1 hypothetical protein IMG5_167590 [Ichthyophthirius multifiliis]|eukprot:XP_004030086.1 hypothetical protein IMG5_167590 [Ichthyophthirius multifiliis]